MSEKPLLSTAYLPPIEYFSIIANASGVLIEKEENYLKQTYRNRCYILSADGPQLLSVPVLQGSFHKTALKDIKIDYSKRWQQVHLRAIVSSYKASPYFEFYFESLEKIIASDTSYLIDLNLKLVEAILMMLKKDILLSYTDKFEAATGKSTDYRYRINPKLPSDYTVKKYLQVFECPEKFSHRLSIIDLLFNMGPESFNYL